MENLSNIISKKIACKDTGKVVGIIYSLCFNPKRKNITGVVVLDKESERLFFAGWQKISIGKDFVIINNLDNVIAFDEQFFCPFGKRIISACGTDLGEVYDIIIEKRHIIKFITNKCEVLSKNIYNFSKDILLFSNKRIVKKKQGFKFEVNKESIQKIEVLKLADNKHEIKEKTVAKNLVSKNEKKEPEKVLMKPFKSYFADEAILGKILIDDMFSANRELIARKGEKVTLEVVKKCKKFNKYNQLIFNSK